MKKLLFFVFILSGCVANQPIIYKTADIQPQPRPIPININIKELVDIRQSSENNNILFEKPKSTNNGKNICINSEKHYKKEKVSTQISRQMAEHFSKAGLFNSVTFENPYETDYYYLTGNLTYFFGQQDFSTKAAVGSQFGLIGALATANAKSPGKIYIEITDLTLYDKNGKIVKEIGNYKKEYIGDLPADAYCWCIYRNMNEELKYFNAGLVDKLRAELADVKF